MPLHRALPFYALLLAACSAPPEGSASAVALNPGPDCQEECAAGFRWAVTEGIDNDVKCRGDNEFARGCRHAVALANPVRS